MMGMVFVDEYNHHNHELKCVSTYMKHILLLLIDKVAFRLTDCFDISSATVCYPRALILEGASTIKFFPSYPIHLGPQLQFQVVLRPIS